MLKQIIAKLEDSSSSFPGERALNEHFEDIYYRPKYLLTDMDSYSGYEKRI